jgi:hypothetical protein
MVPCYFEAQKVSGRSTHTLGLSEVLGRRLEKKRLTQTATGRRASFYLIRKVVAPVGWAGAMMHRYADARSGDVRAPSSMRWGAALKE